MAEQRARIKLRHGNYSQYNANKASILYDEVVIVDSGDSNSSGGYSLYYRPNGQTNPVRVVNAEDVDADIAELESDIDELSSRITALETGFPNKMALIPTITTSGEYNALSNGQIFFMNGKFFIKTNDSSFEGKVPGIDVTLYEL